MNVSSLGMWTGLYGGVTAAVGAWLGQLWEGLVLGLIAGVSVSIIEAKAKKS